jgi:hypothetical protein
MAETKFRKSKSYTKKLKEIGTSCMRTDDGRRRGRINNQIRKNQVVHDI